MHIHINQGWTGTKVVDSEESNHHNNGVIRLNKQYRNHPGKVATAGNEIFEVLLSQRNYQKLRGSKTNSRDGYKLLSLDQITRNSTIIKTFRNGHCIIK